MKEMQEKWFSASDAIKPLHGQESPLHLVMILLHILVLVITNGIILSWLQCSHSFRWSAPTQPAMLERPHILCFTDRSR